MEIKIEHLKKTCYNLDIEKSIPLRLCKMN